jgi:tetratricopeptide (TPR) repeat protein
MRWNKYQYLAILFLLISCTPKLQESPIEEETTVVEKNVEEIKQPSNPCTMLSDLSGALKEETENAYVLYKDQVKLKNFEEALPLWKTAYYNAPAANGSIKYQFEDGIKIYKYFYEQAKDSTEKTALMDTIMSIYDKRIECFGEQAYVAGRKAFDYYYTFRSEVPLDTIFELFKQAVDGKKEKTDYFVINPFTKILSDKIVGGDVSLEEGRHYATTLVNAIEKGNQSGNNKQAWAIINDYAKPRLEKLEGVKGLYDCSYFREKYYRLYQEDPENCEIINMAYSRMLWGGCSKEDSIVQKMASVKEEKCYTPPPPPGPLRLAYEAYSEGDYNEAIKLFESFVENTESTDKKYKYTLLIAKIYYADIKNFVKSREFALAAAELKPESGEPYLLIGKLYASSGPLCGPGRGWDSQIVTWPAIDMFEKASRDPMVADEARKLIRTYWQYMPKKEDIFQRTIKAGSKFKVGCWINRTTNVRTAD